MGKRATSVLVAGIFVLGACSGGSKSAGPPIASTKPNRVTSVPHATTSVPRPTTTTSTPAYSFDDSVPPPKLINTGTNYVAILKSLESYGNWLSAHRPDPARASTILAPGSRLHDLFARDLGRLRDNGLREIEKLGARPTQSAVLSRTPSAVSMRITEDVVAHQTVDESGRVTSQVRFATPITYLILLVLVRGHWLFAADDAQHSANVRL
ncbi:MAG: hypothetical protein JWM72_4301 [Actinomycetia bacterium]|nr:hypothetical protein [Actinomycetes bacterium]